MRRHPPRTALAAVVNLLEIQTAALNAPESSQLVGHWREMSCRKILIAALEELQTVSRRIPEIRRGALRPAERNDVRSACAKVANALAFLAARVGELPAASEKPTPEATS